MLKWCSGTQRRWKKAAENAISPVFYSCERDLLAAEVAKRIWVSHGGQPWSQARDEGSLLLLETMVARHLGDRVLRAALGLRYLETLTQHVSRADYEDARALAAEARWVAAYLGKEASCPLLPSTGGATDQASSEDAGSRRERLQDALVELASTELRSGGLAA